MKKILTGLAAAAVLLTAGVASAATIPGVYDAIFDGQTQVWGHGGASVDVRVRVEVPAGEWVHAIETDFIGDGQGAVCHDVSNFAGAQNRDVDMDVNLPPNIDDYGFMVNIFTADTEAEANAHSGTTACTGDNNAGAYNEGNVAHVIPKGTSNSSVNPDPTPAPVDPAIEALKKQIAELVAQLTGLTGVVASLAPDAICSQRPSDTASLQLFLVGQNLMTSAEVATGPGIYGPKTTRADNAFKTMHKCR